MALHFSWVVMLFSVLSFWQKKKKDDGSAKEHMFYVANFPPSFLSVIYGQSCLKYIFLFCMWIDTIATKIQRKQYFWFLYSFYTLWCQINAQYTNRIATNYKVSKKIFYLNAILASFRKRLRVEVWKIRNAQVIVLRRQLSSCRCHTEGFFTSDSQMSKRPISNCPIM